MSPDAAVTESVPAPAAPPDQASGLVTPRDPPDGPGRRTARIVLWPVRAAWTAVWAAPRLAMWAYDRYQVGERVRRIFFNEDGNVGLFPLAFVETGFGLNVGARLFVRDLFGKDAELRARAGYGGRFRQIVSARASSGRLLGDRVKLDLGATYEVFPKSRFFGVGNADETAFDPMDPSAGRLDPLARDRAVATRYRHDDILLEAAAVTRLPGSWSTRVAGSWRRRTFDPDADQGGEHEIVDVFDTARLVGYDTGLSTLYGELELTWDTRRVTRYYLSEAAPSTGWKVDGFFGYQRGLGDDPSDHGRWGLDVQRYVDVKGGDRTLILRAYVEGVTGALDRVPFVDLPHLGGPYFLRGYPRDRFRDRDLTLATVEYDWSLDRNVGAYVFVDAGRVWPRLRDFDLHTRDGLDDLRVGYGGGLQIHSMKSYVARLLVSTTIDGGVYANFSLDPVFDTRSRQEKP